ncbi:hypothetical protein D3C83_13350 [compost metagenome]
MPTGTFSKVCRRAGETLIGGRAIRRLTVDAPVAERERADFAGRLLELLRVPDPARAPRPLFAFLSIPESSPFVGDQALLSTSACCALPHVPAPPAWRSDVAGFRNYDTSTCFMDAHGELSPLVLSHFTKADKARRSRAAVEIGRSCPIRDGIRRMWQTRRRNGPSPS